MRKLIYTLIFALSIPAAQAQVQTFSDDFESYSVNAMLADVSSSWDTWSTPYSSSEDVPVLNNKAFSGTKSIYFKGQSGGGPDDIVTGFGGLRTSGNFIYKHKYFVPTGKTAYFNLQGASAVGSIWSIQVYFDPDGLVDIGAITVPYPQNRWFEMIMNLDLRRNIWEAYIDGKLVATWKNGTNAVSFVDLFPWDDKSDFWADDVMWQWSPAKPDMAGLNRFTAPKVFCAGGVDVKVELANRGTKALDSVWVHWELNGLTQTPVKVTTKVDTAGHTNGNTLEVTLGTGINLGSSGGTIKAWTVNPNGVKDSMTLDDTATLVYPPGMNGSYSVGTSTSDYTTITEAVYDLHQFGVCGPVIFNVSAGTHVDKLVIGDIAGASATNTITFDGGDKNTTSIEYTAIGSNDRHTILLNGSDHITFKNFTIEALGTSYGIAVHLVGDADSNTIDNCDIIASSGTSSKDHFGIVASGAALNPTSPSGASADGNTFSNLSVTGGYVGVYLTGASSSAMVKNNSISKSEISGFSYAGINALYQTGFTLAENNITGSGSGTIYGAYMSDITNFNIIKNIIYSPYGMYLFNANKSQYNSSFGQSKIINNIFNASGSSGTAFMLSAGEYINFYHNTVGSSGTHAAYIEKVSSTAIVNNIFANMGSGTTAYVIFGNSNTFSSSFPVNYNLYYTGSTVAPVSWEGTSYSSLSAWFSGVTSINANSKIGNPGFVSSADLHLSGFGTKLIGANLGVLDDVDGNGRCQSAVVVGAHESRSYVGDPNNPVGVCVGSTVTYQLNPPRGMTNADYGTKWAVSSFSFQTASGTTTPNVKVTNPSTSANGKFEFTPGTADIDSVYIASVFITNLTTSGCDSFYIEYIKGLEKPKASFTASATKVCRGTGIDFKNTGSKNPNFEYKWYMGDGVTKSDTSFNYNYPFEGTYTVSLVISNYTCRDSVAQTITVDAPVTGAGFKQGSRFDGYFFNGTPNDPDLACVRDTMIYEIVPPPAFTNGDYGTTWEISSHSIKSSGGASSSAYKLIPPSSSGPGELIFGPTFAEADLSFIISTTFKALSSACTKDTTVVRYVTVSTSPTAGFNIKGQCAGEPTFFTDASTVAPGLVVRKYEFGVGNAFATTANPNYTYTTAGEYTVTYTVTGKGGCDDILKKKITIYDQPTADFDVPSTLCAGNPAAFMSTSTGNGTTITRYKWTFNQGTTPDTSDQANVSYTFANPGPYTATLQVWTDGGCNSSVTKNITVVDAPTADFPLTKGCINEPITFVNNSIDAVSYEWRFSDKDTIRTKNAVKTFKFKSSYSVTLVATSASGCRDSVTRQIDFHDQPEVDFTSIGNCAGRVVNFQDATTFPTPSSSAVEWTWTIEGQKKSGDKTTHTFATAGTYNVKLRVKSNYGCTDSFTAPITINPAPVAGMTPPGSACVDVASTFENTSTGTGNSYLWHFGDGETSTDEKPSHTYAATGTYIVKLVTTNGTGCKDSVTEQVTVGLGPEVPFAWCAKDKGKVVTFKADTPSYASYEWDFGDILGGTGTGPNPTYTYLATNGEYTVTLTVTDAAGCVGTYSATVGTGDKDNSTNCIIGIDGMSAQRLSMNIYPNPFSHQTRIEYELLKSQQVRVSVWDATGKQVAILSEGLQQAGQQQLTLDANEHKLSAGLYMIRIETEGAVSSSQVLRLE